MILILIRGHTGNVFKGLQNIFEYRVQTCVVFESKLMLIEFINFRRITFKKKKKLLYNFFLNFRSITNPKKMSCKTYFLFSFTEQQHTVRNMDENEAKLDAIWGHLSISKYNAFFQ